MLVPKNHKKLYKNKYQRAKRHTSERFPLWVLIVSQDQISEWNPTNNYSNMEPGTGIQLWLFKGINV